MLGRATVKVNNPHWKPTIAILRPSAICIGVISLAAAVLSKAVISPKVWPRYPQARANQPSEQCWTGVCFYFYYFFLFNSPDRGYVQWFASFLLPLPMTMAITYFSVYFLIPR